MTTEHRRGTSRSPLYAASALLLLVGCSMGNLPADALASQESEGALCVPVDGQGLATFASQVVTNTTDATITVESVKLDGSMTVEEWFLAPVDWEAPGMTPGALVERPEGFDATSLEPGARATLVMTLKTQPSVGTAPEQVTAQLQSAEGGQGSAVMGFTVATAPVDGACD